MVAVRSIAPSSLALALALACALVVSCTRAKTPPATRPAPPPPASERGSKSAAPPAASLDLQAMIAPVPEYEGTGRNLFAFGPDRRAAALPAEPRPTEPPPLVAPPSRPALTPRPSAPSRLDVKYAGFLEKTRPDGAKAKYAIFLDGNEILAGAEGDTVGNRFTVVTIGVESVTVSARGTNVTQRIPLQSN
jgi:hypothetical protein